MTCHLALRRPLPFLLELRATEGRLPVDICKACGQSIAPPRRDVQPTGLCSACEETADLGALVGL